MFSRRIRKVFTNRVWPAFRRLFQREILVLGDSHARVFHHKRIKDSVSACFFNIFAVGGATASGLSNPNSKTRAYQIFRRALKMTRARAAVVMLGEVDTGFVIWYRSQKYNEPVATILTIALETYTQFLSEVKSRGLGVVVISTPLPTIQDGNNWGEIAKARKEVTVSLRERTDLTLEFNRQVKAFCASQGMAFVDLDPLSLDESGVVAPRLLSPDPNDHHYDIGVYAEMLAPLLAKSLADAVG